jgi:hypothetical protein
VKPIKRRRTNINALEGDNQVGIRNQLTKNFMPNYRTFEKKTLREKSLVFMRGHVSLALKKQRMNLQPASIH